MAFTYRGSANATATAATEIDCSRPAGVTVGDIIVAVVAFEGVAAGSGPWIIPNNGQLSALYIGPSQGWQQACWQSPSATGVGIEVWTAIHGGGTVQNALFAASQNAVTVTVAYGGEYNPTGNITGGAVRLEPTAQVTGNQPPAPSVLANGGELVVAVGGDQMGGGGFGAPSGLTNRVDVARSGAGTVEATIADYTTSTAGNTGPITFPNAAASSSTKGSTATLVIRPAPTTPTSVGIIDAPLPESLDIGTGYTLRVSAIDPGSGAVVSGVNIQTVVLTAGTFIGDTSELATGDWQLVPGPGA